MFMLGELNRGKTRVPKPTDNSFIAMNRLSYGAPSPAKVELPVLGFRRMAPSRLRGFSLTELLVVIALITVLSALSGPAIQALSGAGSIDGAVSSTSLIYAQARSYAMANDTYVRVALCQVNAGGSLSTPATVVLVMYTPTGDNTLGMSNWSQAAKPMILKNICFYNNHFYGTSSNGTTTTVITNNDATLSNSSMGTFTYPVANLGNLTFGNIVEFNSAGEASVVEGTPTRFISIGWDQPLNPSTPGTPRNQNPFILRLAGVNGYRHCAAQRKYNHYSMNRPSAGVAAFSLIELVVALGIVAFALLTMTALLPIGIKLNQVSVEETRASYLLTALEADLRNAHPNLNGGKSQLFGLPLPYASSGGAVVLNSALTDNTSTLPSANTTGVNEDETLAAISEPRTALSGFCYLHQNLRGLGLAARQSESGSL